MRIKYFACLSALLILALPTLVRGYAFITNNGSNVAWPAGTITMKIMVDNTVVLSDGTTRAGSIQAAMQAWNAVLGTVQFSSQIVATGSGGDGNSVNEIFFSNTAYGKAWDSSTLAVTTDWLNTTTSQRLEADIIFNTNFTWDFIVDHCDLPEDLRALCCTNSVTCSAWTHPDLATPAQYVNAIMNSAESDIDTLQADDIAGAQVLYGAPECRLRVSTPSLSRPDDLCWAKRFFQRRGERARPAPSYRWQRLPAGSGTWANLSDNGDLYQWHGHEYFDHYRGSIHGDERRSISAASLPIRGSGSTTSQRGHFFSL